MKITPLLSSKTRRSIVGSTLAEVSISVAIVGFMFTSLYACMTAGFAYTLLARENLRGTQIMLERMEGIRLYNWNQLVYSNLVPTSFTAYYYPLAADPSAEGTPYYGTMTIAAPSLSPAATYSDNLRQITVSVTWTNNGVVRNRSMSTMVGKNGIQNYVYYN
jgi:hypothetical protein